jgi:hypothetical protein
MIFMGCWLPAKRWASVKSTQRRILLKVSEQGTRRLICYPLASKPGQYIKQNGWVRAKRARAIVVRAPLLTHQDIRPSGASRGSADQYQRQLIDPSAHGFSRCMAIHLLVGVPE